MWLAFPITKEFAGIPHLFFSNENSVIDWVKDWLRCFRLIRINSISVINLSLTAQLSIYMCSKNILQPCLLPNSYYFCNFNCKEIGIFSFWKLNFWDEDLHGIWCLFVIKEFSCNIAQAVCECLFEYLLILLDKIDSLEKILKLKRYCANNFTYSLKSKFERKYLQTDPQQFELIWLIIIDVDECKPQVLVGKNLEIKNLDNLAFAHSQQKWMRQISYCNFK